jgi:hypothetical protein
LDHIKPVAQSAAVAVFTESEENNRVDIDNATNCLILVREVIREARTFPISQADGAHTPYCSY